MQSLDLVETIPQTEVYIIYKKEGDLMCYRITEVRNGKNALDHLDISLGLFCATHFLLPSLNFLYRLPGIYCLLQSLFISSEWFSLTTERMGGGWWAWLVLSHDCSHSLIKMG